MMGVQIDGKEGGILEPIQNSRRYAVKVLLKNMMLPVVLINRWYKGKTYERQPVRGLIKRLFSILTYVYKDAVIFFYTRQNKFHYTSDIAFRGLLLKNSPVPGMVATRGNLFADHIVNLLDIKGDDSFLDCGCGGGNNIYAIRQRYPDATIQGFDLSPIAVEFVNRYFTEDKTEVKQGDIANINLLKSYPDNGFDHVLLYNMFSLILQDNIEKTRSLRQEIVNECVRIARKSMCIGETMASNDLDIGIEQKTRAYFRERYEKYFTPFLEFGDFVYGAELLAFRINNKDKQLYYKACGSISDYPKAEESSG